MRQRTDGADGEGVDLGVALCVVPLDVLELGRVLEGRHVPVQVAHPLVDEGVPGADVADVALEVLHVDGIKSDNGHVEPNVGLGDVLAKVIRPLDRRGLQMRLRLVERLEQGDDVALVGLLRGGEARLVDAVVDLVVRPLVCLVDLRAEGLRVGVDVAVLFVNEVVELSGWC